MSPTTIDTSQVRRLSVMRADRPVILSLYLDLDPAEFATPPARSSAIRSLIDEAGKQIEGADLEKDDVKALRAALGRAETFFDDELPTDGVRGVAVFASDPLDLFESITLPQSLPTRIAIDKSPLVAPLAITAHEGSWGVLLVNREVGRLLRGDGSLLREVDDVRSGVHGQHQQGGWSQARYGRSIENEVEEHLRAVAELVVRELEREPLDHLLVGCPEELAAPFRSHLPDDVADRLAGDIEIDVATASPDEVLAAMRPALEAEEDRREREAFDRLGAPLTASGTTEVLRALNERRVETVLIDERRSEPGTACPTCGWLGTAGADACPADGSPVDGVEDLKERVVELALAQDAQVLPVRLRRDELRSAGGIAALLRF